MSARRKSARVALKSSFSKFTNTPNQPLIVEASADAHQEKPQSPQKIDTTLAGASEMPVNEATPNADADFQSSPSKKIRLMDEPSGRSNDTDIDKGVSDTTLAGASEMPVNEATPNADADFQSSPSKKIRLMDEPSGRSNDTDIEKGVSDTTLAGTSEMPVNEPTPNPDADFQSPPSKESMLMDEPSGRSINTDIEKGVSDAVPKKSVATKAIKAKAVRKRRVNIKEKPTVSLVATNKKRKLRNRSKVGKKADHGAPFGKGKDAIFRTRTSPNTLYLAIKSLSNEQVQCVRDMGFGSILSLNIDTIPAKLGRFVVKSYDSKRNVIKLSNGIIPISKGLIHDVIGCPMGSIGLNDAGDDSSNNELDSVFRGQFEKSKVRPNQIVKKIGSSPDADLTFKLNFIVLFANIMGQCYTNGDCYLKFLRRLPNNPVFSDIDWCGFIEESLKISRDDWKPDGRHFCGPLTVLVLIYVDRVMCSSFNVPRQSRAIEVWSTNQLKERESAEVACGGFGTGDILDRYEPVSDADETHPCDSTSNLERTLDAKDFVLKLSSYLKIITDAQKGFEETLIVAKETVEEDEQIKALESEFQSIINPAYGTDKQKTGSTTVVAVVAEESDKRHDSG